VTHVDQQLGRDQLGRVCFIGGEFHKHPGDQPSDVTVTREAGNVRVQMAGLESARNDANTSLSELNTLITNANASGVSGTPSQPTAQPVSSPTIASASIPA